MSIISKYIIQSLVYKVQLSVCAHAFNISPECALSAFYTGLMRGFLNFMYAVAQNSVTALSVDCIIGRLHIPLTMLC